MDAINEPFFAEVDQLLAQVLAAFAFYHANRDELDAAMAAEEAEADRLEREHRESRKKGVTIRLYFEERSACRASGSKKPRPCRGNP